MKAFHQDTGSFCDLQFTKPNLRINILSNLCLETLIMVSGVNKRSSVAAADLRRTFPALSVQKSAVSGDF